MSVFGRYFGSNSRFGHFIQFWAGCVISFALDFMHRQKILCGNREIIYYVAINIHMVQVHWDYILSF